MAARRLVPCMEISGGGSPCEAWPRQALQRFDMKAYPPCAVMWLNCKKLCGLMSPCRRSASMQLPIARPPHTTGLLKARPLACHCVNVIEGAPEEGQISASAASHVIAGRRLLTEQKTVGTSGQAATAAQRSFSPPSRSKSVRTSSM